MIKKADLEILNKEIYDLDNKIVEATPEILGSGDDNKMLCLLRSGHADLESAHTKIQSALALYSEETSG